MHKPLDSETTQQVRQAIQILDSELAKGSFNE